MNGAEIAASGIMGFLLPLAVSLLKSVKWKRPAKIGLCAALSFIIAVIVNAIGSGPNLRFLSDWGVIFGTASTVYATLLEKSSLENKLRNSGVK